jgi:hypothetical protein
MKQIAQKGNKGDGDGDGDPFNEWYLKKGEKKEIDVLVILRCSTYLQQVT